MKGKTIFMLFLFLFFIDIAYAATIHGSVYDMYYDRVDKGVVEVDSTPIQRHVAEFGDYSFTLPAGTYNIKVTYLADNFTKFTDTEKITVVDEGDYVLDLIVFPSFEEEEEILTETESIEVPDIYVDERDTGVVYVLLMLLIVVLAFLVYFFLRKKKPYMPKKEVMEDDLKKYIDFIKKHKRLTQKELRKQFPLSEGKISLIVTELEHKGLVEKIKKGRGNIIIWKK